MSDAEISQKSYCWVNTYNRLDSPAFATDYYLVLKELAKLKRNELKEFKVRFKLCAERAKENEINIPLRMVALRTGCGFVFLSVPKKMLEYRSKGLLNLTHGHKYDQHLEKCIGVSTSVEGDGTFISEWCYIDYPWQPDEVMESWLAENFPFLEVKVTELGRYQFNQRQ